MIEQRLIQCFVSVFPELTETEARHATPDTVSDWDSEMFFTLLGVVEEEFGCKVAESNLNGLLSFEAFLQYLRNRSGAAGASSSEP